MWDYQKLTTCKNQNAFLGNKNVILASESFVGCDSNEKRKVYNILPPNLNHIYMLLDNVCKRGVGVICKPRTNNLAESANHNNKKILKVHLVSYW